MILREQGPYFTCNRCQRKAPISNAQWDDGRLVCNLYDCADGKVVGSVELAQAKEVMRDRQERTPEPKLIEPVDPALQIDTVPASSGVY